MLRRSSGEAVAVGTCRVSVLSPSAVGCRGFESSLNIGTTDCGHLIG